MSLIKAWKMAGTLVRPKGITRYSVAKRSVEGGFPVVTFTGMNKMVGVSQVQFVENLGSIEYFRSSTEQW